MRENPQGVEANVQGSGITISKFKLKSRYCYIVHCVVINNEEHVCI